MKKHFKKGKHISIKSYDTQKNQTSRPSSKENLDTYFRLPQNNTLTIEQENNNNNYNNQHRKNVQKNTLSNSINTKKYSNEHDHIIQDQDQQKSQSLKKANSLKNLRLPDKLSQSNQKQTLINQFNSPNSSQNNINNSTAPYPFYVSPSKGQSPQSTKSKNVYSQFQKNKNKMQQLHENQINNQFSSISDIWNKEQVLGALKNLETKDQRIIMVDKILQRRDEQKQAHHQMQIKKVAPLVNRFIKKIGHKNTQFKSELLNPQGGDDKLLQHANTLQMFLGSMNDSKHDKFKEESKKMDEGDYQESQSSPKSSSKLCGSPSNKKPNKKNQDTIQEGNEKKGQQNLKNLRKERKINLAKVTEKSKNLIDQGIKRQIYKNTHLLSNFQIKNLSSHFKSKLDSNNPNLQIDGINTFELGDQLRPIEEKSKGLQYTNNVFNKVVEDIAGFLDNHNHVFNEEFFVPGKQLDSIQSQIIELRALRKTVNDQQFFRNYQNQRKSTLIGIKKQEEIQKIQNDKRRQTVSVDDYYCMGFQSAAQAKPLKETKIDCQHSQILFSPKPKLNQNNKIRFYQIYKEGQQVEQDDCIHDELEKPELNESFASYTEIKLDLLYKNSKSLEQQHQMLDMSTKGTKQGLINLLQSSRQRNYNPQKLKKQQQKVKQDIILNHKQIIELSKQKMKNNFN